MWQKLSSQLNDLINERLIDFATANEPEQVTSKQDSTKKIKRKQVGTFGTFFYFPSLNEHAIKVFGITANWQVSV